METPMVFSSSNCLRISLGMLIGLSVVNVATPGLAADKGKSEAAIPTALLDYVSAEEESYQWKHQGTEPLGDKYGEVHLLELTSQTWQGIPWKHIVAIFEPAKLRHPDHGLLFITGGSTGSELRDGDKQSGAELARLTGTYCIFLLQVPNQPLFGDHYEDDLITETFLKYLDTRDPTWPLLFPMVKSAVRAMDATQEFTDKENEQAAKKFVVTGASKRGWTTWLTGVVEPRVIGIAPMVIDTLNFAKQTKYQIEVWGKYSEQINDYTSKGLVELMEEKPEIPLFQWVDPYTYRKQLTLPKLLINGTNDPYWVVDALNNYWDDLVGSKQILYIPNAGHGLKGGRETVLRTLAAFSLHLMTETPLPEVSWKHSNGNDQLQLVVDCSPRPRRVLLWSADSTDRDFRDEEWSSQEMTRLESGQYRGSIKNPEQGHAALYGEIEFEIDGVPYSLCTQLQRE